MYAYIDQCYITWPTTYCLLRRRLEVGLASRFRKGCWLLRRCLSLEGNRATAAAAAVGPGAVCREPRRNSQYIKKHINGTNPPLKRDSSDNLRANFNLN